jgi:TolB-like protein
VEPLVHCPFLVAKNDLNQEHIGDGISHSLIDQIQELEKFCMCWGSSTHVLLNHAVVIRQIFTYVLLAVTAAIKAGENKTVP